MTSSPPSGTRTQDALFGIAWARAWRERNRSIFDALDEALTFSDSPTRPRCPNCGAR
jgi:hypothetical protein